MLRETAMTALNLYVALGAGARIQEHHHGFVATTSPSPSPSPREFTDDDVQPGPAPLLIITTLLAVSWLLVRSMRRHLRRVPTDLDVPARRTDS
jgi:hypothetical protein